MSSSNIIILQSSDGQAFEVEEAVALKSQTIKVMIEEYRFYRPFPDVTIKVLPIVDVPSTILSMVIEYCKKHVDTPAEDLKSFDSDFVKVDQGILFDLILAANSLGIKSLLDVAYEAVADMIKGKTTEEIRMTLNIQNDFTPEEEEQEVYKSISRMTAGASECGQKQDSLDNLQTSKRMRMSEYIVSLSHQKEMMIRLPVAAVVECRRVSKAWKSLIDSLEFITAHSRHSHTHSRHLIVTNYASDDWAEFDDLCLSSYCDDESFPLMQPAYLTAPSTLEQLLGVTLVGCSHGLVCLRGYVRNINMQKAMQKAVIWNPSIGKAISVDLPGSYSMCVGFGVCPVTCDPKLLWLEYGGNSAEWWTYSSGTWRPITMLPEGEGRWSSTVTTKYSIYSRAIHNKIVSFHLTHESFQVTDLPDGVTSLRDGDCSSYYMSKIEESLALIVSKGPICGRGTSFDVWLLNEDGVQRSFTKLFNITSPSKYDRILARSSNGMLTMLQFNADDDELDADFDYVGEYEAPRLVAYKLESGHTNADGLLTYDVEALTKLLEIGDFTFFSEVHACEESLLLLDCHNTD